MLQAKIHFHNPAKLVAPVYYLKVAKCISHESPEIQSSLEISTPVEVSPINQTASSPASRRLINETQRNRGSRLFQEKSPRGNSISPHRFDYSPPAKRVTMFSSPLTLDKEGGREKENERRKQRRERIFFDRVLPQEHDNFALSAFVLREQRPYLIWL